jgi:hypothetical protein
LPGLFVEKFDCFKTSSTTTTTTMVTTTATAATTMVTHAFLQYRENISEIKMSNLLSRFFEKKNSTL